MIYCGVIFISICFTMYNYIYRPISCQYLLTKMGYYGVYFVSYIQIKIRNILPKLLFNNKNNLLIDTDTNNDNQLFIILLNHNYINRLLTNKNTPLDKTINHNIYLTQNEKYELSDIHFIDVSLSYDNNIYPITFKTDTYNFYIVYNKIDKHFIEYYMRHFLKILLPVDTSTELDYKLDIIDHNADLIELTNKDTLILYKQDYIIN